MSIVCIGIGDATMGRRTLGPNGEVVSETKAHWESNPQGGSVAVWTASEKRMNRKVPWSCTEIGMLPTTYPEY